MRLREHISALKTSRASAQRAIVEVNDSIHDDEENDNDGKMTGNGSRRSEAQLEQAVMMQELMAGKEELADLRAQVYLLEKEKVSQELRLADRTSVEAVLRGDGRA